MDPNEAAQKLLSQDPFHEVRRKRDKKKEVITPQTQTQSRRPRVVATPSPKFSPHDATRKPNGDTTTAAAAAAASSSPAAPAPPPQSHSGPTPSPTKSRPPSSRAHQKVGPSKEWKPKPSTPAPHQVGVEEPVSHSLPPFTPSSSSAPVSQDSASKQLHLKFEELHISHDQHVIIPNHLQVPQAQRTGLSFGSFDADFGLTRCYNNAPANHNTSTPLSHSSPDLVVMVEEPHLSNQIEPAPTPPPQGDYAHHLESPKDVPDNSSNIEPHLSSTSVNEYDESNQETSAPVANPQYSVVHTAPNYNFGIMPPILGTQFAPFDTSEPQSRDTSRIPSFVVPQPFDPSASYFTQYYRPSTDGDGRFSPFLPPGAANKYNGNIAMLSPSLQESGNTLVHSTAGPTPLATQAAGVVQSSLAATQQPVPVFRQPSGVHLPHYPPNYIPYSQYFSPFYVPPQAIHHYLTNPAFQQAPAGSVYPPPAAATATGVKFSLPQYKPVTNTGNSTHVGIPSGYAPYSSSPTGYSPSPAASTTNSTGNEELSASQYKENNVYITGQQSEGPAVWIPAQGRDISGLQPSSFYSLSPQGQHVTFTPTQAGHGAFAGIYHPTQTMGAATVHPLLQQSQSMAGAVEMVGPQAGAYQQPQRAQMNWTNNY